MRKTVPSLVSLAILFLLLVSAFSTAALLTVDPSDPPETENAIPSAGVSLGETAASAPQNGRKSGTVTFLLCGKDRASGLCDVILLARLDTKENTASLVQIPRDTYAAYTDGTYRKLNGAASALGGIRPMADFLEENLGIPIDHYALLDLDSVGDAVDAIGGVTLEIPVDMDYEDASQNLSIHLKAGTQTLCGDEAEQFLRFRSGYATADLGRLDAHKRFVSAFLDQVKSATLPELLRVVRSLYGRIETDLSFGETVKLVSAGLRLRSDRLAMATLPGEAARTGVDSGAWYYILTRSAAFETVADLLNVGTAPLPSASFDPAERFTNAAYPHFDAIYRKTARDG